VKLDKTWLFSYSRDLCSLQITHLASLDALNFVARRMISFTMTQENLN
jgi:hypothetical protein